MSNWWDKDSLGAISTRPSPAPLRRRAGLRSVEFAMGGGTLAVREGSKRVQPRTPPAHAVSKLARPNVPIRAASSVARASAPASTRSAVVPAARRAAPTKATRPVAPVRPPKAAPAPAAPPAKAVTAVRPVSGARSAMLSRSALGGLLGGLFGDADPALGGGNVDVFGVPDGWTGQNACWVTKDLWAELSDVPSTNGVKWKHRLAFPVINNTELANHLAKNPSFWPYGFIPLPFQQFLLGPYQFAAQMEKSTGGPYDGLDVSALRGDPLPRDAFGTTRKGWWGEDWDVRRTRDGGDLNWELNYPRPLSASRTPVITTMNYYGGAADANRAPTHIMPISGFVEGLTEWTERMRYDRSEPFESTPRPCDFWRADGTKEQVICFSPWGYPIDLISYYVAKIPSDQHGAGATRLLEDWLRKWGYLETPRGYPPGLGGMTVYDVGAREVINARNQVAGGGAAEPELPPTEDIAPDGGIADPFAPSDDGAALPSEGWYPDAYGFFPDGSYDPAYDTRLSAQPGAAPYDPYYDPSYNPAYPQSQGYQDAFPAGGAVPGIPTANEAVFDLLPAPSEDLNGAIAALRLSDLSIEELELLGLWVDDQGFVHDGDGNYLDDEGYAVLDANGQPLEAAAELELEAPLPFATEGDEPIAPYAGESWG